MNAIRQFLTSILFGTVVCLSSVTPSIAIAQDAETTQKAVAAAETFLTLLDEGKYAESWDTSAAAFRNAVTKEQWRAAAGQVRGGLGKFVSRSVMTGTNAPQAQRNAQGEFIVVKFMAKYSNLAAAIETVAPMKEADGQYRVSGYFVQPAPTPAPAPSPTVGSPTKSALTDDDIKTVLRDRIDVAKRGVGIVVGLVDQNGTRVITHGAPRAGNNDKLDGDSIFEIGSITKTFTAILLADMVARGEVKLDDPISKYLPNTVKTPVVDGKEITLEQLSRHTSGLPRLPANMKPKDASNPYADYTVEQLYAFLNDYKASLPFGKRAEYSNLGVGLLGHILALRAGIRYEALVQERITKPLGMNSTGIVVSPVLQKRLTTGHNQRLPVSHWDIPTLAGAGALRSTANDMLKYLAANMGLSGGLDARLLTAMQTTQVKPSLDSAAAVPNPMGVIGLGWFLSQPQGTKVVSHGGGTGGYQAYTAFDPAAKRGVVVLSNSTAEVGDIALHLLDTRNALKAYAPPKLFTPIKIDAKSFDEFVGVFEIAPGNTLTFSRDGERFFATVTGLGRLELLPYEPLSFFARDFDAQVTFVRENAKVEQLTLRQDGIPVQLRRVKSPLWRRR